MHRRHTEYRPVRSQRATTREGSKRGEGEGGGGEIERGEWEEGGESESERDMYLQGSGFRIDNIVFSDYHHKCIDVPPQLLTLFVTSLEERGERDEEEVKSREERR